jgi:hypothetical protein
MGTERRFEPSLDCMRIQEDFWIKIGIVEWVIKIGIRRNVMGMGRTINVIKDARNTAWLLLQQHLKDKE